MLLPGCSVAYMSWFGTTDAANPICDVREEAKNACSQGFLSVRAMNVIARMFPRPMKLSDLTKERLLDERNCGQTTVSEILRWKRNRIKECKTHAR